MARAIVFLFFFIVFLILKALFIGGKKAIEIGAEAFDKVNGTNFSENFKELNIAEAIIGLLVIGAYENGEIEFVSENIYT
jgi:mannose/fructose/N-acetylgalactosamine-specific phosphotransferase system component IID